LSKQNIWQLSWRIDFEKKISIATLPEFDMANLLVNDEAISEYLSQVLDDGDNDELLSGCK
jgi:DNA-binding phage protein